MIWEGRGFSFDCSERTLVMGILNVTPDSFSDGGDFFPREDALNRGLEMVVQGADIIDVGGESTRPGSEPVELQEELDRVCPVIERLADTTDVPISIDTYKAKVAKEACKAGASIINDISGLHFDKEMVTVASKMQAGLVLMHIKGTPKNMQTDPRYENLFSEIILYLKDAIDRADESGIPGTRIVLDPGIGFGKKLEHNLSLIGNLERFSILRRPLLIGLSRKSFIGMITGADTDDRLHGGIAAMTAGVVKGAHIVRVHDITETVQAIRVTDSILKAAKN